jgi:hypothetical protein
MSAAAAEPAARADRIREILEDLIRQRQLLRLGGTASESVLLEANRLSIVYWQTELARELLDQRTESEALR